MGRKQGALAPGAALLMLALAPPAWATPIPPGSTVVPDTSPERGSLLAATSGSYTAAGPARPGGRGRPPRPGRPDAEQGSYQEAVFTEADGTLDFVFQVSVRRGSVSLLSVPFAPTDVTGASQSPSAPGLKTGHVAAAGAGFGTDGSLDFAFSGRQGLHAGATSFTVIVRTDLTSYTTGDLGLTAGAPLRLHGYGPPKSSQGSGGAPPGSDGGPPPGSGGDPPPGSGDGDPPGGGSDGPPSGGRFATPEPGSLVLLGGLGAGAAATAARRRRSNS